ncbi:hypothetical protein ACLOJK_026378 [Asimina triloba]
MSLPFSISGCYSRPSVGGLKDFVQAEMRMVAPKSVKEAPNETKIGAKLDPRWCSNQEKEELNEGADLLDDNPRFVFSLHALAGTPNLQSMKFCYAGFHIVSRTALDMGVSKVVFPVYRNIIALILLAPCAYLLEKKERPPLTFSLVVQFFLLSLCGITANQGFYLLGLYYASPTFASAIQNSVTAITFAMVVALRLEEVMVH